MVLDPRPRRADSGRPSLKEWNVHREGLFRQCVVQGAFSIQDQEFRNLVEQQCGLFPEFLFELHLPFASTLPTPFVAFVLAAAQSRIDRPRHVHELREARARLEAVAQHSWQCHASPQCGAA